MTVRPQKRGQGAVSPLGRFYGLHIAIVDFDITLEILATVIDALNNHLLFVVFDGEGNRRLSFVTEGT